MNFSTQCTVDTQILRDFVYTFPATHVATLNLAPGYRNIHGARKVCSNFVYKFNSAIWGRDGWKSRERILGVMPAIHNKRNVDVCHLHLAFYGFPERLTEDAHQLPLLQYREAYAGSAVRVARAAPRRFRCSHWRVVELYDAQNQGVG